MSGVVLACCWKCVTRAAALVGLVVAALGMAHSLQWVLAWAAAACGPLGALCIPWTSLFWSRTSPELPRKDLGLTQRMQCEIPIVTANVLLKA